VGGEKVQDKKKKKEQNPHLNRGKKRGDDNGKSDWVQKQDFDKDRQSL